MHASHLFITPFAGLNVAVSQFAAGMVGMSRNCGQIRPLDRHKGGPAGGGAAARTRQLVSIAGGSPGVLWPAVGVCWGRPSHGVFWGVRTRGTVRGVLEGGASRALDLCVPPGSGVFLGFGGHHLPPPPRPGTAVPAAPRCPAKGRQSPGRAGRTPAGLAGVGGSGADGRCRRCRPPCGTSLQSLTAHHERPAPRGSFSDPGSPTYTRRTP